MSSYQLWVCFLCFLVTTLDGFDMIVIGVATPKIAEYLHTSMKVLGLAMGVVTFGPLIGAVLFGMPADRIGRKWMLAVSAFVFGLLPCSPRLSPTWGSWRCCASSPDWEPAGHPHRPGLRLRIRAEPFA